MAAAASIVPKNGRGWKFSRALCARLYPPTFNIFLRLCIMAYYWNCMDINLCNAPLENYSHPRIVSHHTDQGHEIKLHHGEKYAAYNTLVQAGLHYRFLGYVNVHSSSALMWQQGRTARTTPYISSSHHEKSMHWCRVQYTGTLVHTPLLLSCL